ncbi:MAG: hypothetical protein GWO40_19905 [Gammaproteobacteria bacterium]|nr:hypothetical protein [Gammaproteobacteria bacterium]NIV53395.1 hypothetical protein [Gammaproteobacteria bacterium]NIX87775.1 hypothetical protein [Gammaproteobacteria bacterium]
MTVESSQGQRFPEAVRQGMRASGASATCVPVRFGGDAWEAALFVQVAEPECKRDRRVLSKATRSLQVSMEADLIENPNAAVVMLRLEVFTLPDDPLASEILLTPGGVTTHFETLKLLAQQRRLCWFFGDQDFNVIHSQQHPLTEEQRAGFDDLLRDAIQHDSLIRLTARYDARAALAEVVEHYELREGVMRTEYHTIGRTRRGKPSRS